MPIQLKEENHGKLLVVQVSGKLVKADYEYFVPEFDRLSEQHDKLRVMFDMSDFQGWEASAMWEDIKFGLEQADVERLAMVGENKWENAMATLSKPFTKVTIRYFDHANVNAAREWLGESQNKALANHNYKRKLPCKSKFVPAITSKGTKH
jgi:hypothetical protein